jgi:hypothetical protein
VRTGALGRGGGAGGGGVEVSPASQRVPSARRREGEAQHGRYVPEGAGVTGGGWADRQSQLSKSVVFRASRFQLIGR